MNKYTWMILPKFVALLIFLNPASTKYSYSWFYKELSGKKLEGYQKSHAHSIIVECGTDSLQIIAYVTLI